jgi:ribose transport system permease protein
MRAWLKRPWLGPLGALVATYLLFSLLTPDTFLRGINLLTMLRQTAVVGVASVGMTLVIVLGGIDLSVGSAVALTTVVVARALQAGMGPWQAALIGIGAGTLTGLVNGLLVAGLRLMPFIVTLGTMSILRGAAKGLAGEQKIDADPRGLDQWMLLRGGLGVPSGVWLALLIGVLGALFISYTRLGRHVVAVGSNERAARLCGVAVPRVVVTVYALAGLLAGLAGVLEFSTLTVGDPTDSVGLELEAIASVVIGGGSLSGGQGSVAGTLLGALLLTVIKSGCVHVGLPNWVQEIFTGVIIVIAMGIDRARSRASA